jgi:adenylate kinase
MEGREDRPADETQIYDLVIFGSPGAGRRRLARFLAGSLGWPMISSGDLLRQASEISTRDRVLIRSSLDAGFLVPEAIVSELVLQRLERIDAREGSVIEGFPRTRSQYLRLVEHLEARGRRILALELTCDEESALRTLGKRYRGGEGREIAERRLALYRAETLPLLAAIDRLTLRSDDPLEENRRRALAWIENQCRPRAVARSEAEESP